MQRCAANLAPAELALPRRLQAAGAQQPAGAQVHLPWALGQLISDDGCIPATAQETLLQAYLGEHLASTAASLAQRWGHAQPAPDAIGNARSPAPATATVAPYAPRFTNNLAREELSTPDPDQDSSSDSSSSSSSPHRPPAPATAATPQTQEPPPPNHFHHSQATRAHPTSHFKDGASRKHLLVSIFTLQATSWSSPDQHSEHHHLSSVDPSGVLCTLHWTKSTQHPTTTAWNTNGRGNFGCSSPGCCSTAHAM